MANPFAEFRRLLPAERTLVVAITANNGDGTSTATTLTGSTIIVQGESVAPPSQAFVRGRRILGPAPDLPAFSETV